ncbi:GGDEF domain-containing protein [Litchfieldella rifensis]|uniref:diguanylate cyclase n=1 Tax=Litchfieldella rifensis TaxID=762643 RepID=A0ABV7LRI7_9GAMM
MRMEQAPTLTPDFLALLDTHAGLHFVRTLWEHFPERMFIIRVEGPEDFIIEAINPAQQTSIGIATQNLGQRIGDLLPGPIGHDVLRNYARCVEAGTPIRYEESGIFIDSDGTRQHGHWLTLLVPIKNQGGIITHLFGVAQNLTELRLAREALERQNLELERRVTERTAELLAVNERLAILATRDFLTDAYNRRHMVTLAEAELRRANRYDLPLCALMLDIDDFKGINDRCGHAAGDHVLRQVAKVIRETLRDSDLVGRYGGDEFMILIPETPLAGARESAERLRTAVQATTSCSISLGLAQRQATDESLDELLSRADAMLMLAKRNGRNRLEMAELIAPG